MQEVSKQLYGNATGPASKQVQLCIQLKQVWLQGEWEWDLQSQVVYCSDVMFFPDDFIGTKSIIHPDDVAQVKNTLDRLEAGEVVSLQFRIITTYGEVKTIKGEQVAIDLHALEALPDEHRQLWDEALATWHNPQKEANQRLRIDQFDALERLQGFGSWYINAETNEVFYSDNVFRLHGLAAQCLNAHANTFTSFIHPEDQVVVSEALDKAFMYHVPVHLEYRILKQNGEERLLQLVTQWRYNFKGQQIFTGLLQDITELNADSQKLAEANMHLFFQKSILQLNEQHSGSGNWYINLFTKKTTYSDNYYRIYGIKQQVLPSYNAFLNLVHPDDRYLVAGAIERMYREHVLPEMEYRIILPDGKMRYLRQSGKLIIHGGKELMLAGTVQDITVRKGLERKVQELQENIQLQNSIHQVQEESAGISVVIWYLPDGEMHWTDGFYRLLGYKPGGIEPLQRQLQRNIHPADVKAFNEAVTLVLNNQPHDPIQFRVITRAGISEIRLSFQHMELNNKPAVAGIAQDITSQIALQQQLAERTEFAALLSDTIKDSVIVTNTDHTIMGWNRQAETKTGIKAENALHENLFDVLPRLKDEEFMTRFQSVLQGNSATYQQLRDGYQRGYYDLHLAPLRNDKKEVTGVLHLVHDITKERELQVRLSERLNFIEQLVEASVDRIIVLDRNMNYLYWNRQAEAYYGIRKERVLGKNIMELFPAFRTDPTYQEFRRVLKGETVHLTTQLEDGSIEYFETYLIPIKAEKEDVLAVLWIVHDLSAQYRLQREQSKAVE